MFLKELTLNNFKNFADTHFDFSQINCIVGGNGIGKTNILDAIYYLSFSKSFLGCNDNEIIKYGEDFFCAKGLYQLSGSVEESFTISLKKGERKTIKHGKQPYKRFSQHIGKIPCVICSPADSIIINGRSEQRRKFTDIILSQTDVVYMNELINYNKCLEQRNKLLKYFITSGMYDPIQLEIWNEKLAYLSDNIQEKRKIFFKEFIIPFRENYSFISQDKEDINAEYLTYEGPLLDILHKEQEKDRILGYTTKGIHRDDILLTLNNHSAARSASQGQQKTFTLSLKLAQFDYIKKNKGVSPILLLDDIFDKFDFSRVEKILALVAQNKFNQVFLTDTHLERVKQIIPDNKKENSTIIQL